MAGQQSLWGNGREHSRRAECVLSARFHRLSWRASEACEVPVESQSLTGNNCNNCHPSFGHIIPTHPTCIRFFSSSRVRVVCASWPAASCTTRMQDSTQVHQHWSAD